MKRLALAAALVVVCPAAAGIRPAYRGKEISRLDTRRHVVALTLDGGGTERGLFVYAGKVDIDSLAINNMVAKGGDGGFGAGGGGAGLGGGLFIGANVPGDLGNVTLTNVSFTDNQAVGGGGRHSHHYRA